MQRVRFKYRKTGVMSGRQGKLCVCQRAGSSGCPGRVFGCVGVWPCTMICLHRWEEEAS